MRVLHEERHRSILGDALLMLSVTVPSLIRIAFKIIVCFQRHDVPLIFILYR